MRIPRLIAALAALALGAASVLLPASASAGSLKLTITGGTTTNAVADNSPGDSDPLSDVIISHFRDPRVDQAIGRSWDDGEVARLYLGADFEASRAGTMTLTLEQTDFSTALGGPGPLTLFSTLAGEFTSRNAGGATISARSTVTSSNGDTSSVVLPPTPIGQVPRVPQSFGATDYAQFLSSGPYSIFAQVTIAFSGPGRGLFSFDTSVPVPAPELGTLLLVGSGLIGATGLARRRMSRPQA